ncbi:MAG: hypothetical protein I3273_05690 [Candidatus Moeniiplasma glomeromycotorum]|nr:hypothetical protein [Candidatus Moeniiplasma glomeromycotorum]MCE8168061.1 hypothetical protein [Candidatus Moeniiplasma glomeromycotorum]MCE8169578.1 hypothetical protein [Candidatus Moeniiplasma glomeromycotorum]
MIVKDADYWKEYNQKNDRKEYMKNLMKEKRASKKLVANILPVANTNDNFFSVANKNIVANQTEIEKVANTEPNIPVANNPNQKINLCCFLYLF